MPNILVFGHPFLGAVDLRWVADIDFNSFLPWVTTVTKSSCILLSAVSAFDATPCLPNLLMIPSLPSLAISLQGVKSLSSILDNQPAGIRRKLKKRIQNIQNVHIEFSTDQQVVLEASKLMQITEKRATVEIGRTTTHVLNATLSALPSSTIALFKVDSVVVGAVLLLVSKRMCFVKRLGINYAASKTVNVMSVAYKAGILHGLQTNSEAVYFGRVPRNAAERLHFPSVLTGHLMYPKPGIAGAVTRIICRYLARKHRGDTNGNRA